LTDKQKADPKVGFFVPVIRDYLEAAGAEAAGAGVEAAGAASEAAGAAAAGAEAAGAAASEAAGAAAAGAAAGAGAGAGAEAASSFFWQATRATAAIREAINIFFMNFPSNENQKFLR